MRTVVAVAVAASCLPAFCLRPTMQLFALLSQEATLMWKRGLHESTSEILIRKHGNSPNRFVSSYGVASSH
jgi:hypothetical protein